MSGFQGGFQGGNQGGWGDNNQGGWNNDQGWNNNNNQGGWNQGGQGFNQGGQGFNQGGQGFNQGGQGFNSNSNPSPTSVFPGSNISLVTLVNTVLLTPSKVPLATKFSTLTTKLPKTLTSKSMISQVTRTKGSPSPIRVKT